MTTVFATYSGCVQNTCIVDHRGNQSISNETTHDNVTDSATADHDSGLGGQIGKLFAAVNTVGWNHHQVPPGERIPVQEQ